MRRRSVWPWFTFAKKISVLWFRQAFNTSFEKHTLNEQWLNHLNKTRQVDPLRIYFKSPYKA